MQSAALNVKTLLDRASDVVDRRLEDLLPPSNQEPTRLHSAMRHSVFAGGKRFRPALVIAVGEAFGAEIRELEGTAAAIELIHTYSLIHDDLPSMDDDELRRGKPTCHVEFGEATAILAGDVLQTFAFKCVSEDESLSSETRVKLISEIAAAAGTPLGMVAGQQLDLEAEGKSDGVSVGELERIHTSKTGAMIRASARCGAMIAGAGGDDLDAVSDYAGHLGLIFQITDDLLDVTETTETLGKTAGKDEAAAKSTYPSLFGVHGSRNMLMGHYWAAKEALEKIEVPTGTLDDLLDFLLMRNR